uniref:coiled-coil domain-containing protein 158-like isoform X3 n=1 Tax=Gasterosteus aculeatus aculeatus TaxID=481459 RepID=UPI001A9A0013|nr:coiled-coil domain-containing protein 158-like isoform X3 [Gasterosteus aculeatus aculeatus]
MSSEFLSRPDQSIPPSSNNGCHLFLFESPPNHSKLTQAGSTDIQDAIPRLRFNSLTLDELSDELDRRTKETQRLQEEVEKATKVTLERLGSIYSTHSSPGQSCQNSGNYSDESPGDSSSPSTVQTPESQPPRCDLDSLNQGDISCPGKEMLGKVIDDCIQQLSDLQLNKPRDQTEQETFSFNKAIVNLQAKLHKVREEKAVLSNLRLKDSTTHVSQMENMLSMLEELQNIKRAEDQKLREAEDEALAFHRKVELLERNVKEMYSLLSHGTQRGDNGVTGPNVATAPRRLSPAAKTTEDVNNDSEKLQERLFSSIRHLGSDDRSGVNKQNERMEDLIESLGQEVALLTDKLSSSTNDSFTLCVKLELLKKLAERQTLLHRCQVSELESSLCRHTDKVCCLELQLIQAQSDLSDAQREKASSLLQTEELQSQLDQFKALLRQKAQEGEKSQELLEDKKQELLLRQHETQHQLARLEEAQSRCRILHAEGETLRLRLDGREKRIEGSTQMQNGTIDDLHQQNGLLSKQLNQRTLTIQQLTAELDRHKSDLAAAEQDRLQLQASVAEQSQRAREETLEKQQLAVQLDIQRLQLRSLNKEHEELQQLHSAKNDEHEGAVLKLQSQIRTAHDERDQVRCTLRTLEGADGHGLRVAMDMQKEITARRKQVDSLQSKIKHLEETIDQLYQEKRFQSLEKRRQLQQLMFVGEEKRQLGTELEALRSKDKQLRERVGQLEAILHKMSESFADCKDFLQLKEQDFFRLKLQHALDLKELQGQNLHTAPNVPPSDPDSPSPSSLSDPPSSQHVFNAQITRCHAQRLRSPVRELRGVISENHRPHTEVRRRSAPEREHGTAFTDKAEGVEAGSRWRRRTCGSETHFPKEAELSGEAINKKSFCERGVVSHPATAARFTSSPLLRSLGRKSPVYSLLTSDPNSGQ